MRVRGRLAARKREERNGESFHETRGCQGRRERQQGSSDREHDSSEAPGGAEPGEQSLVGEPFTDEPV